MPATPYCTDEDIFIRAPGDFPVIVPRHQRKAQGPDGVVSGWVLSSASTDFGVRGVASGMVCKLAKAPTYPAQGDFLVVDSAASATATLRRAGDVAGQGDPPAAATGVAFSVMTFGPQIERSSYDLSRRFGIDDRITGRRTLDLYDPAEIREACVLQVIVRQYQAMSRDTSVQFPDDFYGKYRGYSTELEDQLQRLVVHWKNLGANGELARDVTTRFSMRLARG